MVVGVVGVAAEKQANDLCGLPQTEERDSDESWMYHVLQRLVELVVAEEVEEEGDEEEGA